MPKENMDFVEITYDRDKMKQVYETLVDIPRGFDIALSRGINDALTSARALAVRTLQGQSNMPAKIVRDRIKIFKATRNKLYGKLWVGGKGLPITAFDFEEDTANKTITADQKQSVWLFYHVFKKLGLYFWSWHYHLKIQEKSITYTANGKRITVNPAFLIKTKSGYLAAFEPDKSKGPRGLKFSRGPGLAQVLRQTPGLLTEVMMNASRNLYKNVDSQVALLLERRAAGIQEKQY